MRFAPTYARPNDRFRDGGVDADDLIIIDEMAYIAPELFYEVILPLIGVNRARILGISTPTGDTHNFFQRMLELRYPNTDDPVFASFILELVCKRCKRLKLYDSCRHMEHKQPQWKGSAKMEVMKLIYGNENSDIRARESLGVALSDRDAIFEEEWVKRLERRILWDNYAAIYKPKIIFMGCDPNAGGSSHMAIVSTAYILSMLVVVAIDSHPVHHPDEVNQLLHGHIRGIRANPFLKDAKIVFIAEKNTGFESARMSEIVEEYPHTYSVYQHREPKKKRVDTPRERPGIFTDHFYKNAYAMAGVLYLEEGAIMFLESGIAGNPWKNDPHEEFTINTRELAIQLKRCRRVMPTLTFDNRVGRVTWSGKVRSDGRIQHGLNDDIAVTFCLCVYWADRIMKLDYPSIDYAKLGLR